MSAATPGWLVRKARSRAEAGGSEAGGCIAVYGVEGEVEIVDYSGDEPKTVTTHHPGEFTGDISHLTGLPAVVTAVARGDCKVYEITGDALRNALNQCPGLSDIILQAFIAKQIKAISNH